MQPSSNLWPSSTSKIKGDVADILAGFDPEVVDSVLTILANEGRLPPVDVSLITIPPSVPPTPPTTPPSVPPSPPTTPPQGCVPWRCGSKSHGHKK